MSALDDLPELQNFCCCLNLETGAILISVFTFLLPEITICAKIIILTHKTTSLMVYGKSTSDKWLKFLRWDYFFCRCDTMRINLINIHLSYRMETRNEVGFAWCSRIDNGTCFGGYFVGGSCAGKCFVSFLTFDIHETEALFWKTEKPQLPPHISLCCDVLPCHLCTGHSFGLLCSSLDKYGEVFLDE